MTLTNTPDSRPLAALASLAMRVAGIVIILSALLDIIIASIPYQVGERGWQLTFTTTVVDRGLVPLVGLALLFAGYWIESLFRESQGDRALWQTVKFWVVIFASFMGVLYVILFPLHLNNVRLNNVDLQERLTQEAKQAEIQLQQQISVGVQRQRAQISQLITASDEQLNQAVTANLINEQDAALIRRFKENPETLDPYLQQQAEQQLAQDRTRLQEQQQQASKTARTESLKSGLRVGLNSLLLAIGYITIGWVGLRLLRQVY